MSTNIHKTLAAQKGIKTQAAKVIADLANTFSSKRHLFEEKLITVQLLQEGSKPETTSQSSIQTSVDKELDWVAKYLIQEIDTEARVAEANTRAKADIIVDGKVLVQAVPAATLLNLEKSLTRVLELVKTIPTLDPAKGFVVDQTHTLRAFQAREVRKVKTAKVKETHVAYEATDKHPAQTSTDFVDKPIGTIIEQEWSSLVTPATKSDIIGRVDTLLTAVRQARSEANEATVDTSIEIGKPLLDYVFHKNNFGW